MRTTSIGSLLAAAMVVFGASGASAQSSATAAGSWNNTYSFPTPAERQIRLQFAEAQKRADSGAYGPAHTTTIVNNYNTNDHSVGEIMISAAEGAYVHVEPRTGPDSGTNTYTVGSVNTSQNEVIVTGDGNVIDLVNSSTSTGCQDGSITSSLNQIFDTFDISSSGASGSGSAAAGSSTVSGTGEPCTW